MFWKRPVYRIFCDVCVGLLTILLFLSTFDSHSALMWSFLLAIDVIPLKENMMDSCKRPQFCQYAKFHGYRCCIQNLLAGSVCFHWKKFGGILVFGAFALPWIFHQLVRNDLGLMSSNGWVCFAIPRTKCDMIHVTTFAILRHCSISISHFGSREKKFSYLYLLILG